MARFAGTGSPLYYHHDAVGSVVGLSNSAGDLTNAYDYTAFGTIRERTGTSTQPFQYLGNSYEEDAKLYDFHARAYDPSVGRFLTTDPVAGLPTMPQTLNPYSYGYNAPLVYPDPYGDCPVCLGALVVAGRAAVVAGEVVAADAAFNAGSASVEYYISHRDKGPFDAEEFARTVGQETVDRTIEDVKNPLNLLPTKKIDRAVEVLRIARTARAARRQVMREQGIPTSRPFDRQTNDPRGRGYEYDTPAPGGGTKTKQVVDTPRDELHGPHYEAGTAKHPERRDNLGRRKYYNEDPDTRTPKSRVPYSP